MDLFIKIDKDLFLDILVERGLKDEVKNVILNFLKEKDENYILDEILIFVFDKVGKRYDSGDIFLL